MELSIQLSKLPATLLVYLKVIISEMTALRTLLAGLSERSCGFYLPEP